MTNSITSIISKVINNASNQINKVTGSVAHASDKQKEVICCNYQDNYYGDQYCQTK